MGKFQHASWVAIYCLSTRKVLIARRSNNVRNPQLWNFFGGSLDKGETPTMAALRELQEEAGLTLDIEANSLTKLGDIQTKRKHLHLFVAFVIEEVSPILNAESSEACWVSVEELVGRKDLHMPTAIFLPILTQYLSDQQFKLDWQRHPHTHEVELETEEKSWPTRLWDWLKGVESSTE